MTGLLLLLQVAHAVVVTTTADVVANDGVTSLREALAIAGGQNPPGTVDLSYYAAERTYPLSAALGPLNVPAGVTVDGHQVAVIDASALTNGAVFVVGANATLRALKIRGAPGACVRVTGDGADIGVGGSNNRNFVYGCGGAGIIVEAGAGNVTVRNNVVGADALGALSGVCTNPAAGCGGIQVRSDAAQAGNLVDSNTVVATQGTPSLGQGNGILIASGAGTTVIGNLVGTLPTGLVTGSGNLGYGIAASPATGAFISGLVVDDNVVVGNGLSGIFLGPRSDGTVVHANSVGLDADLTVAGNGRDGIAVFASDDHVISDNVVVGNAEAGVHLAGAVGGDWQSGTRIEGNTIGAYDAGAAWVAGGNGLQGILTSGQGGGTSIVGNTVSANQSSGIVVGDPGAIVQGNRVGTDLDGTVVLGNLESGIVLLANGATVGGRSDFGALPALTEGNLISGNGAHGVLVADDTVGVLVRGNAIGTSGTGSGAAGFGNGQAGVYIGGGSGHRIGVEDGENAIVDNDRGIEVDGAGGTDDVVVRHNRVGVDADAVVVGNDGTGIHVHGAVTNVTLERNDVAGNGAVGIELDDTTNVELERNTVRLNDLCGYRFLNGANETASQPLVAPVLNMGHQILDGKVTGITGTFTTPPSPYETVRIEVFHDKYDTEHGAFVGYATFDDAEGVWSLDSNQYGPVPDPALGRVSAIQTVGIPSGDDFVDLRSSDAGTFCGDGCIAAGTGPCRMGDPCEQWSCDATWDTCVYMGPSDDGTPCIDGDSCTLFDTCHAGTCSAHALVVPLCTFCTDGHEGVGQVQNVECDDGDVCTIDTCIEGEGCAGKSDDVKCGDGNDCTADECTPVGCDHELRPADFLCEDGNLCTGVGVCDGAGNCTAAPEFGCPFEYCNATRDVQWGCDPDVGCVVVAGLGSCDGFCDLWDLCPYTAQDPAEVSSCPEGDPCLGCPTDCPEGDGDGDAIPDDWELSGIDADCDGTLSADEQDLRLDLLLDRDVKNLLVELDYMGSDGTHDHHLDEGLSGLLLVKDRFLDISHEPIVVYIDQSEALPHRTTATMSSAPSEEVCTDWLPLTQTKQDPAHFAPWRYGIFHYAISGHFLNDCLPPNRTGVSEGSGDDFLVTLGQAWTGPDLLVIERGTFMHEKGHNLGLGHSGGPGTVPQISDPINYQSSMSYRYQTGNLRLVDDTGTLLPDYSHEKLRTLDEAALVEGQSILDPAEPDLGPEYFVTRYDSIADLWALVAPSEPEVDWNDQNGTEGGTVQVDVNHDGKDDTVMEGKRDWDALDLLLTCGEGDPKWVLNGAELAFADEIDDATAMSMHAWFPSRIARVDVGPACASNEVATDGSGKVQLVLFGRPVLDVSEIDLGTVRVRGAVPTHALVTDVDHDDVADLLVQVDAADLGSLGTGARLDVSAVLQDSRLVTGWGAVTWVATTTDGDGDSVRDSCDLCPSQVASPPDADGCP